VAVSAAVSSTATRRGAAIAIFLAIAAALGIAVFRPQMFPDRVGTAVREQFDKGANGLKEVGRTVAGIFEGRSPGERFAGLLANLKQKRHAPLHQRALPKIRGPVSPLAGIVGAPVVPPIMPPAAETPLFNVVNGATPAPATEGAVPGGSPIVFPGFTFPPRGGGGVIGPSVVTAPPPETPPAIPVTPVTPVTPSVPEPATWAMMLLGFVMIGHAARRARSPDFAVVTR
jgi:PEP-CTERM motif